MADTNQTPRRIANQDHIMDPLEFAAAHNSIKQQDAEVKERIKRPDTLYVDPLELAAKDAMADRQVQEIQKLEQEDLERRLGGQKIEPEIGGWLLVVFVVYLAASGLAFAYAIKLAYVFISGASLMSLSIISLLPAVINVGIWIILATNCLSAVVEMHHRRKPLKQAALISTLLAIMAAMSLFQTFLGSISNTITYAGGGATRMDALYMSIINVAQIIILMALATGNYAYFSTSKRVQRTLYKKY
ncbi:MAG: hypothetical protein Q4C83_02185 [Candidatus Saccharibacteria bacterium]|nr:hypothetical protein [Candidatus Saccharibacteria bacterium]